MPQNHEHARSNANKGRAIAHNTPSGGVSYPAVTSQLKENNNAPVVQREVVLKDSDENIYEDQTSGRELGFIGKDGSKAVYFFADYDGLMRLVDNLSEFTSLYDSSTLIGNAVKSIKQYEADYGEVWQLAEDGTLIKPKFNFLFFQQSLIHVLNNGGSIYWPGGSSNRNPRAIGKLFSKGDLPKDQLLEKLGIPAKDQNKYNGVDLINLDEETFKRHRSQLLHDHENVVTLEDQLTYLSQQTQPRSKNARFRVNKKYHKTEDIGIDQENLKAFNSLPEASSEGWVNGFTKIPRGEGQAKAMKNWNALGAAAFANKAFGKSLDLSQNWEWLHIRASQIGGKTVGGNLVAGLYGVNSNMIPYENLIKKWDAEDPGKLQVHFYPEGIFLRAFAEKIIMDIATNGHHKTLGNIPNGAPMQVSFSTITGKVVDKLAAKIESIKLEQQVKQALGGTAVDNQALVPAYRAHQEDASARFLESLTTPVFDIQPYIQIVQNFADNPFLPDAQLPFLQLLQFLPPTAQISIASQQDDNTPFVFTFTGQQPTFPALLLTPPTDEAEEETDHTDLGNLQVSIKGKGQNKKGISKSKGISKNRETKIVVRNEGKLVGRFSLSNKKSIPKTLHDKFNF
jgi:hypothetical protein